MHGELRKIREKNREATAPHKQIWKCDERNKAMINGIRHLYTIAKEPENFMLFGVDAIETLTDLTAVLRDKETKQLSMLLARQLASMSLQRDMHADWIPGTNPTPVEVCYLCHFTIQLYKWLTSCKNKKVLDVLTAMYTMERIGVLHSRRGELMYFLNTGCKYTVMACEALFISGHFIY